MKQATIRKTIPAALACKVNTIIAEYHQKAKEGKEKATKIKAQIIPYTDESLRWHLQNNVFEPLTDTTIDRIIETSNKVNVGELILSDLINNQPVMVYEMLDDLHIDYNDD